MSIRAAVIALCAIVAACTGGADIAQFGPADDFALPQGVMIGMSASELREERTGFQFIAYQGLREERDGTGLLYRFADAGATDVGASSRLKSVSVTRTSPSWDAARTEWRKLLSELTSLHGPPANCEDIAGASPGITAGWKLRGAVLTAAVRRPLDVGNELVPDRVILTYSGEAPAPNPSGKRVDCG